MFECNEDCIRRRQNLISQFFQKQCKYSNAVKYVIATNTNTMP